MPDLLSEEEVDALLNAATDAASVEWGRQPCRWEPGVEIYDFKRPERLSQDHIRSLEILFEPMAKNLSDDLSGSLRTLVDVKLAAVEQLTYHEFLMSLPNPTYFSVLRSNNCNDVVMEINPSIMVPIIDKLLGGGNWSHKYIPERSASDVETNLFKEFVLKPCLVEISKSLNFVHDGISFQLGEFDTNPMLVSVVPSNEVVILSCFEVKMGDTSGMLNVCIPYPAIEHVMDSLSTINTLFKRDNKSGNDRCVTEHDIGSTVMELIVYERFKNAVSLKEVGEFKEGAVISLCRNAKRNPNLFKMSIDGVEKTQVEVSWAADANKNNPIVYDSGVKVN